MSVAPGAAPADRGRSSRRRHDLRALAVVLAACLGMFALASDGYFFHDDLLSFGLARRMGLNMRYLTSGAFGHFFPGYRLAYYVVGEFFPMNYSVALGFSIALYAGILWAMHRLLTALLGSRTRNLAVLAVFGMSAVWIPCILWWSSALNVLPSILATIGATDGLARYWSGGRTRHAVQCVLAFVLGLLFYEKVVLLIGLLPLFALLFLVERQPLAAALRATLARGLPIWIALAVLTIGYVVAYFVTQSAAVVPQPSPGVFAEAMARSWLRGLVPLLVGGPLVWQVYPAVYAPAPPAAVVAVSQGVLLALVVASVVAARRVGRAWRAWRAWLFLAVAFLVNMGPIAWTRAGLLGPDMGRNYKYIVDVVPFLALAVALAFFWPADGERADTGIPAGRVRGTGWRLPALLAAGALYASTLAAGIPAVMTGLKQDPGRAFDRNLRSALAEFEGSGETIRVFDGLVPSNFVNPHFYPFNSVAEVLPLYTPDTRFDFDTDPRYAVTPYGRIVAADLNPALTRTEDDLDAGGFRADGGRVERRDGRVCLVAGGGPAGLEIPADLALSPVSWYVRIRHASPAPVEVALSVLAPAGPVDLGVFSSGPEPETRTVRIGVAAVGAVRLDLAAAGVLCIDRIDVGAP